MDKQALGKVLDEYEATRRAAWSEYAATRDTARSEYTPVDAAWSKYVAVRDAALSEYGATVDAAWLRIAAQVGDPLVTWIIKHCSKFRYEALDVLRALPASLAQIDELARQNEWCDAWGQLRLDALSDGVVFE